MKLTITTRKINGKLEIEGRYMALQEFSKPIQPKKEVKPWRLSWLRIGSTKKCTTT